MDDLLWPHFQPLWRDLVAASSTNILVAGGYGLFLKQRWLSSSASLPTVVRAIFDSTFFRLTLEETPIESSSGSGDAKIYQKTCQFPRSPSCDTFCRDATRLVAAGPRLRGSESPD